MVDDTLQCATLPGLDDVIKQLPLADPCWLLVETLPVEWVDVQGQADGLQLNRFIGQIPASNTRGRIFCPAFELRWEWLGKEKIQVVYCGTTVTLNGFEAADELAETHSAENSYFLWGTKVQEDNLPFIDYPAGAVVFAEMQVRRLLHYPVSAAAQRVKLCTRLYYDVQHNLIYYRFYSLEEDHTTIGRST